MPEKPSQSRVWVRPNRITPALLAVLLAMWYAGASQGNGAAYLLCFVLLALGLVSYAHTRGNLRDLALSLERLGPAFAGDPQTISVALTSRRQRRHYELEIVARGEASGTTIQTVEPGALQYADLTRKAPARGCYRVLELEIRSTYPLGFFTASQRFRLAETFWIYPAPVGSRPLPHRLAPTRQPRAGALVEGDDYGGVRAWRVGESQRHIDWKAAARGQGLLTKQWLGEADEILSLEWSGIEGLETEARLSQLARWVVLAERGAAPYELHLPGQHFPPGRGDAHYHACLRALAEFSPAQS